MVIAIDGLSTNGKTTLARKIAQELNFKNFNTGAIYRCIALTIIQKKLNIDDIDSVIKEINKINIDFQDDKVIMNGKDVSKEIRTEEISIYSTKWAAIPQIKAFVVNFQKEFIINNDTVMEGRDIAERIAPNADIKFYLYSDFETRVNRLWLTTQQESIENVRITLQTLDDMDVNTGLFIKPTNAIEIDTTNHTIEEVFNIMMREINKKISVKKEKIKQYK